MKKGLPQIGLAMMLGSGMLMAGNISVENGVAIGTVDYTVDRPLQSMKEAKPMVKKVPAEILDTYLNRDSVLEMLTAPRTKNSEMKVEPGSAGSGSTELKETLPKITVLGTGNIGTQEYGADLDRDFTIPYTTSRVDMFYRHNKTPFSRKYPYSAAGQLFFKTLEGSAICSASMIKRGILVTAAHCVSEYGKNRIYSDFQYVPARRLKTAPYGVWKAKAVLVLASYLKGKKGECLSPESATLCRDDVALIVLNPIKGKYAGDYSGWYAFGYNNYGFAHRSLAQITELGYPYSHDKAQQMQRNDSLGMNGGKDLNFNTIIGSRMTGGSSGGPWLVNLGERARLYDGVQPGKAAKLNVVVGVTSWGPTDQRYKYQGASPFTKGNIKKLVTAACRKFHAACQ